jgi:DNA-binding LacI/PurR family transcriptional regulator
VMDVARSEFKLSVPNDLSIIGYDDVPEAGWGGYALTTVSQPAEEMVRAAVSILLEQIEQGTVIRRAAVLPSRLVARASAKIGR